MSTYIVNTAVTVDVKKPGTADRSTVRARLITFWCSVIGHNWIMLVMRDNGRSCFAVHKCTRCGEMADEQYDYTV